MKNKSTVYTIEIVSDCVNYDIRNLKKMLKDNLNDKKQSFKITRVEKIKISSSWMCSSNIN